MATSRISFGICLCIFLGPVLPFNVGGQDQKKFVKYPPDVAKYLQRLHGQQGALRWRKDFPGGFSAWQKQARAKHRELLGLNQIKSDVGNHEPRVLLEDPIEEEGYTRSKGRIETEPDVWIPFWLLRPIDSLSNPRPLVLCAHGHDSNGWNTYAGVYRDQKHEKQTLAKDGNPGVQAVKRGYVALVPATRGLASAASIPDPKNRHGGRPCRAQLIHCLLAGRTAVGERVWDTQRILDWALREVKGIDPEKVVMLGNSGGGILTIHSAAIDERIAIAIPNCSFTAFTSASGFVFHCDCCLIPRAQTELAGLEDIGALAAPRPVLAVNGRKDGLHSFPDVERAMSRVQEIYAAADSPQQFEHRWGEQGHQFYPRIMWPFVQQKLEAISR